MNELSAYVERVRRLAPGVSINSVKVNRDGLLNDVVIVNDELIFRFPKHEYAFQHLKVEAGLLRLLQNYITLDIPLPLYQSDDGLAYRMIPGETLRRDMLLKLPEADRQAVADQLAQFFKELHGLPFNQLANFKMPGADALMKYQGWVNLYGRIRETVLPLLMPHVRAWIVEHFEAHLSDRRNFEYELKVINADIPPYHIMYDRRSRRVNGVIDFGCAGLGDPAVDLGIIVYNYGETFVERFYHVYPEAEIYLKRARFYAGAQEVRWLLTGIERNDPWWFAVHTGSAKDMRYS